MRRAETHAEEAEEKEDLRGRILLLAYRARPSSQH